MANSHVKRKTPSKTGHPQKGRQMKERCWGSQPRGQAAAGWTPLALAPPSACVPHRYPHPLSGYRAHSHQRGCWHAQRQSEIRKAPAANGGQINSQKETSPAKESLKPKRCPGVVDLMHWRKAVLTFLLRPLPAPSHSFWLVLVSLLRAASCWQAISAKWAPIEPVLTVGILVFLPGVLLPDRRLQSLPRLPGLFLPWPSGFWSLAPTPARGVTGRGEQSWRHWQKLWKSMLKN